MGLGSLRRAISVPRIAPRSIGPSGDRPPGREPRGRARRALRPVALEHLEPRPLLSDLGVAQPYNFFVLGAMNEMNSQVGGRLAVGGAATLMNFGVAPQLSGLNGGRGADNALVSGTFLTFTNGSIGGDLHYNDNAVKLTSVGVTGTTFPNSTPIDFGASQTSMVALSQNLATAAATGTVSVSGTTITLTGNPASSLNVFNLSGAQLQAATNGRLNITNVSPTSTVLVNINGTTDSVTRINFEYNGVGGDQAFAQQVVYNFFQATSLTFTAASPLGSVLAPLAAVVGSPDGEHIAGTLVAGSLSGVLAGVNFPFAGNLPTPGSADLALAKAVDDPTPNVGDTIHYTIGLGDAGPSTATGVTVSEPLPLGLAFVSATPSEGTYDPATGTWAVGTVTTSAPQSLVIAARVVSAVPQTNTATIAHSDQFDPDTTNNTASSTVTPQQAELAIVQAVSDPTPNVGDTITFAVAVNNLGPDGATGVTVADRLPPGLQFVSAAPSQGTYDPATGTWSVGSVALTAHPTLAIQAEVVSPAAQTNTAAIAHADQFDPVPGDNSSTVTVAPQQADLVLTKTVDNPTPNVGQHVTFTVFVINTGPDDATKVTISDPLHAGLQFVSATPGQGTYDPATGTWSVGTVPAQSLPAKFQGPGSNVIALQIVALVTSAGVAVNTATITHADQFDPDPSSNTASAATSAAQADLTVLKEVDDPRPNVGDTIHFTVEVANTGPSTATGVTLGDPLPPGLQFLGATPSQGTYGSGTGVWTVGTVPVGELETLVIQARVASPAAETNVASVLHSDQPDPNPDNDTSRVTVTPQQADLAVAKAVSNPAPNVGGTVGYTIVVNDLGPDDATGVRLSDLLPAGLQFVSAAASAGTYDPASGLWSLGAVSTVVSQRLVIIARVAGPAPRTNTATIVHSDQFDPNPANNTASAAVAPQQADLAVAKAVNNPTPNVGDVVRFTVALANLGPNTATGVTAADPLPAGLAFVSAAPSQGTYDPATGSWSVGSVARTGQATLTLFARVVSPAPQTNVATITRADQFDPDTTNNTAGAGLVPQQADLAVAKAVNNPTPTVGDTVDYTVALANLGPNTATGVLVSDPLPAGLQFVSAATTEGAYDPATGTWSVGSVGTAVPQSLVIAAKVIGLAPQVNTATITRADQFDPNPANNAAGVGVLPHPAPPNLAPPTVTNLQRFGFHAQPTVLVVTFHSPLDPARARDVANYRLVELLGRRARRIVPIKAASYDPVANIVTLSFAHPAQLALHRFYQLTIVGSPPSGLTGPTGVALDGRGNGTPGTDFVRVFGPEILAGPNRPRAPIRAR